MTGTPIHGVIPPVQNCPFSADEIAAFNARHDRIYGWRTESGSSYTNEQRRPETQLAPPNFNALALDLTPDELTALIWEWHRGQINP